MIEAKFFTVGTYLYKYNLTVLFVSPLKIAHEKFYIYCPPLLLNEIYAHALNLTTISVFIVGHLPNQQPRMTRNMKKHCLLILRVVCVKRIISCIAQKYVLQQNANNAK